MSLFQVNHLTLLVLRDHGVEFIGLQRDPNKNTATFEDIRFEGDITPDLYTILINIKKVGNGEGYDIKKIKGI